jgi:alkylhydroperoxidase family enzyme
MSRPETGPRIEPLEPPYSPEVAEHLAGSMPAWTQMQPLALFRTWARHRPLGAALRPIGRLVLSEGSLDPRDREILILRVCARCGAEYEWGVHAVSYPGRLGIPAEKVAASVTAGPDDALWSEREALLLRVADELHETSHVSPALWEALAAIFSEEQLLELLMVVGFYHAVAFTVNALELPAEPWAARFPTRP